MRINHIRSEDVNALAFPGSAYNVNCAFKTLRRMLNLAYEWELIAKIPKIKLAKEIGRNLLLHEEAERKILPFSGHCYISPLTFGCLAELDGTRDWRLPHPTGCFWKSFSWISSNFR